jgi:hypothetical protein
MEKINKEDAQKLLSDAWWGGKNKSEKKREFNHTGNDDGTGYVIGRFPLDRIRPNEEGGRYDGTVDASRVAIYVGQKIDTPVHLMFGERSQRNGNICAGVMDGGHRVSAARIRGETHIEAIMLSAHYERLISLAPIDVPVRRSMRL